MTNTEMTSSLEMHWTEVPAADGRTRMEARWILVDHADSHAHAA